MVKKLLVFSLMFLLMFSGQALFAEEQAQDKLPPVTGEDLIGKWLVVKAASVVSNEVNPDGSPHIVYMDEENGKEQMENSWKKDFPDIQSFNIRFVRIFKAGGTGEYRREMYINGRLSQIVYTNGKESWKYTDLPTNVEKFKWMLEGDMLKLTVETKISLEGVKLSTIKTPKNYEYKVAWTEETKWKQTDIMRLLWIVNDGKYERLAE